jgi:transketolase
MRKTAISMVHKLAQNDDRVVFIGSDLSPGLLGEMKAEMPDRHYMEGVAEAHVIGMAAGMAMDGFVPFVNTIATFITRRCYEQVALDLCLHDLPVRLIANGGGVVYAPLGPTHLAVEDISIMRSLPNMTVTAVSDAEEMVRLMEATVNWPHPIYIRLGKGGDKVVSKPENGFEIGKGIRLLPAEKSSGYLLMISCGVMSARCLEAASALRAEGIDVEVVHIHTIKPLDIQLIEERAKGALGIVTVEEHTRIGGLGSAVLEAMNDKCPKLRVPLERLGLPDYFARNYGGQDDLLSFYGLQPDSIAEACRTFMKEV